MWIVQLALKRPYTFVVMALLIVVLGVTAIRQMRTDIFPEIDIPVITVIWTYKGMESTEVERRITTYSEYAISSNVNDIKRLESQTLNGVGVIKIYFHPGVNVGVAMAQVTAVTQSIRALMPPGIQPPVIVRYNASSVPILQISLSSDTMSEEEVYDYGLYILRTQLSTVQGLTMPTPYGGRERQVMVDLDPQLLQAKGISPKEVADAINAYNLAYPTGVARIDTHEYPVALNNSPLTPALFNEIPIKVINGATVYMRDVAQVRDGSTSQTTIVRRNGSRGALVTLLKNGNASTLEIVNQVKAKMPDIQASAPKNLRVELLFDQSLFVTAAIEGVVVESIIAGLLTAAMILVFLGSWRSTLIVAVSIPLAILSSIVMLYLLGHSLNVMTLGGLALAVGILVDDATVEIENIHRNLGLGKPLRQAILDGAMQIAGPTFVSTLTISIVFVSVLFLEGPPKYLFTPLALAVAFAMMASYLLSRTIVPTMVDYLLPAELAHGHGNSNGFFGRFHKGFERLFEQFRSLYVSLLEWNLQHRFIVFAVFGLIVVSGFVALPWVGRDFFPTVDTGQFRLHVRAPAGTRVEQTERYFTQVEEAIREIIPQHEVELVLDNIGLPNRTYAMAFGDSATTGMADGEILVSLSHHRAKSTPDYIADLRRELPGRFPQLVFFFQPADIVSQILNFGLPAPIDIQIAGMNRAENQAMATEIAGRIRQIQGVQDVHLHQVMNVPKFQITVDQTRARELGLTQQDVANSLLVSLSGSGQVQPNYWVDPNMGISYLVETRTPTHKLDSVDSIEALPLTSPGSGGVQLLSNLAKVERGVTPEVVNHTNVQPAFDVYANVQGRDLGSVASEINRVLEEFRSQLKPGNTISMRGQVESMESAFFRLGLGLVFAAVLVYLLMVVNFQSWLDPFIIITALPGAFVGIVWSLFLWDTTFSVPALMGAIMSIGVATANSILLVTFANEQRSEGKNAWDAALEAGRTRMRPVLMTAAAMIIGMLPMSLGLGEGGEQNAPLGRAVIGGLLIATLTTLLFVPVVYSLLRTGKVQVSE
ncbi:Multidrug resistance protein MdtC [Anatilimnocola aggregata]|uniref:Multidrug resistance protein MdtC n=1 Tax=Anatilimnocola aggregata TaxID=2528021 RepID=A0A517YG09_9BACT|nr:efflux RND transporter permease subunit [Anatilimnocola aggregata]QDU29158.1 Multidrug resistance protein MdtC [Anatilimnocola aggregata]